MTIWHPLIDPNQQGATTDSNLDDMAVIRGLHGEARQEAMQAMVLANIPLVMFKVESYIRLYPKLSFLHDDLVSEGILGLTTAVDKLAKMEIPNDGGNPTAFISQRIAWTIGWFVDNNKKQNIPYDYSAPLISDVDPTTIVDTQDLLDAACQTEEDFIIMEMRSRGCVDQEIADRLSIARSSVQVQRHELMQRYDALVRENL